MGIGLRTSDVGQGDLHLRRLAQGALNGGGQGQPVGCRGGFSEQGVGVEGNGVGQAGGRLDLRGRIMLRRRGGAAKSKQKRKSGGAFEPDCFHM